MALHVHEHERAPDEHTLSCLLRQRLDAPAKARAAARKFLAPRLEDDQIASALVVISELVTNAAKFGEGYAIWLHLLLSTDRLAVTVASNGTDALVEQLADGRVGRAEQPLFAEGGRGLGVVLDLWDSLAVSSGRITIVRAERTLQHWRPGPGPLRIRFENFAFVRQ